MKRFPAFAALAATLLGCLCGCRRRPAEEQFRYDLDELKRTDAALVLYEAAAALPLTLGAPAALAVDSADRIHVCNSNTVQVLSPTGRKVAEFGVPAPAHCLAVAPDLSTYVGVGDHVVVLDTNGAVRATWPADNENGYVTALAVMDGTVFAADAGNRLVLRYDSTGTRLGEITGKKDPADSKGFIVPSPYFDLARGRGGTLWVTNPGRRAIQEHSVDGAFMTQWGHASMQADGFCGCCNPTHLAALPDGSFITAEKGLVRVKVYSPAGEFTGIVAGPESFAVSAEVRDIGSDSRGRVLVLDSHTPAVRGFTRKQP